MVEEPLLSALSDETSMPPQDVQRVLTALAEVTRRELDEGRPVNLPGFGVWSTSATGSVHVRLDPALSRTPELPDWWTDPGHEKARRVARAMVADLALYRPEMVPRLTREMPDEQVHQHCSAAYGPWWHEARRTFKASVDPATMEQCDHLADTARQRWSSVATD